MKLGAVSLAYNEEKLIKGCIKSLEGFVDRHVICVSEKPYFGEHKGLDNTAEIAEDMGAEVVMGTWPLDHMQRNAGIALLQDCDWIITTDADMWIERHMMHKLIDRITHSDSEAFIIRQRSYFKDVNHRIVNDDFMPVIAIRPHVRFIHIGNIGCPFFEAIGDLHIHHLTWCAPKNIYQKVMCYPHAPEFNGEQWYREHYENWEGGDRAILPTGEYEIADDPLPDELKAYL